MALSWPKIITLRITADHDTVVAPSIYTLADLAHHCPHLQKLCLPGVEVITPPPPELKSSPVSGHALKVFTMAGPENESPPFRIEVADPAQVAEFLDTLFPQVRLEFYVEGDWERVIEKQEALQAARRNARARAEKDDRRLLVDG
ncbi:hypothetical protein BKA93DRAFT_109595 [Sparassis latifolia]